MKCFFTIAAVLFLMSCTSVKTTTVSSSANTTVSPQVIPTPEVTPAGNWDYTVTGTPEGNFAGVMTITLMDKSYTAKMISNGRELEFNSFGHDKETNKVSGEMTYNGTSVSLDAKLSGDEINGAMGAEGMSFPFKATRKK